MEKFSNLKNIKKANPIEIVYFDLFSLLKGLESERPGIKKRVWDWLSDDPDVAFLPYNGRLITMNLYYYGIGDEYDIEDKEEGAAEYSYSIHPEAFKQGTKEYETRLDLNLIWFTYQKEIKEYNIGIESFYVKTSW
jgi:hypothetical protein